MNEINKEMLKYALKLSEEILENIEMSTLPLTQIALKSSRLARLLNNYEMQKIFQYEASGYPVGPDGISQEIWKLGIKAKRIYQQKDAHKNIKEYMEYKSLQEVENSIEAMKISLSLCTEK